ncbi:MAG: hypothetical protein ABI591_18745 [Kofleriaceae bacterium]
MRTFLCLVLAAGCLGDGGFSVDTRAIDVPRGAGVDVAVDVELAEVTWLADAALVHIAPTSDGRALRVTGVAEGDTVVHFGAHGDVIDLPTHVAPPAIVQLWIAPVTVSLAIGGDLQIHATAVDTTATILDVRDRTTWQLVDPTIAAFDPTVGHDTVVGKSAGHTTLRAVLDGVESTAPVDVY